MQHARIVPCMLLILISFAACTEKTDIRSRIDTPTLQVPNGFPEMKFSEENPYSPEKWLLGKKLFYEKALSVDYSISCASCHKPEIAFSDFVPKSTGAAGLTGRRNAPSLANVGYHPYFTREGGVPTLEMQVLVPIQEHDEFNFNIVEIAERLKRTPEYVEMSNNAFGRELDPYVITRAIGIFERTLISGNSQYDSFINGYQTKISIAAQRGANLFFSERTGCSSCHSGFNYTNYSFANNGLYDVYPDNGREHFTGNHDDDALFKTPSLRNIAVTAPYMHDGSISTLRDVIAHYNNGGKNHKNKSPLIRPLGLSKQDQENLLAFLNSLTDNSFIQNKLYYNNEQ